MNLFLPLLDFYMIMRNYGVIYSLIFIIKVQQNAHGIKEHITDKKSKPRFYCDSPLAVMSNNEVCTTAYAL